MSHIFISYSRKDIEFAQQIVDALAKNNLDTWVDWKSIPKGEDWWEHIQSGIEEAEAFVFLVSPGSTKSQVCSDEIEHAVKNGKRILPVVILDVAPQDAHPEITKRNWIFCRQGSDEFDKAIETTRETIHTDYEWLKFHTRLLVKTLEWDRTKDISRLLRGKELSEAEEKLVGLDIQKDPQPTELQRQYLLNSRRHEERQRRQIMFGLGIGLVLVAALAVVAWGQRNVARKEADARATAQSNAEQQKEIAIDAAATAQRRADESQSLLLANDAEEIFAQGDPFLALPLAMAANEIPDPPNLAQATLTEISYQSRLRRCFESKGWIWQISISPDGKTAITSPTGGYPSLWDISTGKHIKNLEGLDSSRVVFSPIEGSNLILSNTCAEDADNLCRETDIVLVDITSGEIVQRFTGHNDYVGAIAFSPDGHQILSGSNDKKVILWDVKTGKPIHPFIGHTDAVNSVAFSPDGTTAISGGRDALVIQWDLKTGEEVRRFVGHQDAVNAVAFHPIWESIFSASEDNTIIRWSLVDGYQVKAGEPMNIFEGHDSGVSSLAIHPDGLLFASGGSDKKIILWNIFGDILHTYEGHSNMVTSLGFSKDGQQLLSSSGDTLTRVTNPTIILWDVDSGAILKRLSSEDIEDTVEWLAFSPDGKNLLVSTDEFTLQDSGKLAEIVDTERLILYDIEANEPIRYFRGHTVGVNSAAFSPDGSKIVSSGCANLTEDFQCTAGEIILWETSTGEIIRYFDEQKYEVYSVAFSPDGKQVLSVAYEGNIFLWDVSTGKVIKQLGIQNPWLNHGVFSPDGKKVLIGGSQGELTLWDVETGGKELSFVGHTDFVKDMAFSRDGSKVISGSDDKIVYLWDAKTGAKLHGFTGHTDEVLSVDISPDGTLGVSGGKDGQVLLWDLETGDLLRTLDGHNGWVNSVAFSPNGDVLASGDTDKAVILWRIQKVEDLIAWTLENRHVRELTCDERITHRVFPLCEE